MLGLRVGTALYSVVLKRLVILDVMTIAGLFILQWSPARSRSTPTASEYLLVCTAMLALFLGFTKRRQEAILGRAARRMAPTAGRSWSTTRCPSSTR